MTFTDSITPPPTPARPFSRCHSYVSPFDMTVCFVMQRPLLSSSVSIHRFTFSKSEALVRELPGCKTVWKKDKKWAWYLNGFFSFFFWLVIIIGLQLDMRMWSLCFVKYNCRVKDEETNLREGSFYARILVNYFTLFNLCVMFPFWKKKCYRQKNKQKTLT